MKCLHGPSSALLKQFYVYTPHYAVTSEGDLVSLECTGKIKIRQFMKQVNEDEIVRFWMYMMEWNMMKLALLSRKHKRIVGMVQLKDLDGLSMLQATCPKGMSRFGKINSIVHMVYPETLTKLIVLNIPPMFGMILRLFKPLLPARTFNRFSFTSRSSREQKQSLERYLDTTDRVVIESGFAFYEETHSR